VVKQSGKASIQPKYFLNNKLLNVPSVFSHILHFIYMLLKQAIVGKEGLRQLSRTNQPMNK